MKTKLLALALVAGSSMFAETRFSISIGTGGYNRGYYAPAPYAVVQPPCPGPDYGWVDGYYSGRNAWVPGYWARQPHYRPPSYDNRFYNGYARQGYARGYDDNRNRGFEYDRDERRDRDHGYRQDYRPPNGYDNGFRNRN